VYQYLKFGDYRYSLKPGAAPDGDQLAYFLFDSKKGYCSYFAFAFASLLRSIGVPCRIAVGFFLNPDEGRLDFYPVRSNMAHAWVEIWFPGFGWIEYDPTTENLAADEEFQFGSGTPAELFERLMKEIIDNHGRLKVKEAAGEGEEGGPVSAAVRAGKLIKKSFACMALIFIAAFVIVMRFGFYIRCRLSRDPRRKTLLLWRHIKRRLRLAGARKSDAETENGWADRLGAGDAASPLRALYDNVSAAKFAERYTDDEREAFFNLYKAFDGWYKKRFGLLKRFKTGKKRGAPKLLALVFCMLLASSNERTHTQENGEAAEALFSQAFAAENNEFWERAIELYMRGKSEYPLDYRFPLGLGGLYFDRELYRLAMDEFVAANGLLPGNTTLLYRLAQTAGSLNENRAAAGFLESLLAIEPDNREAIGLLGWMYFKLHRLRDGEKLLADAIERFGAEPDFCMTLGTIYSDMFDYTGAKNRYLEAVNGALGLGGVDFAALAYYNLSILESRFYRYEDAFSATISSLMLSNRASGHLARGELMLRRLDMDEAFAEYFKAYEIDKSQLSKLSLAQGFLIAGDLEQARLYAENSLASSNLYWMLNYGIDPAGYRRDLHEILYKTYSGLANAESLTARYGLPDITRGITLEVAYRFRSRIHRLLYQKYSLLSAGAFETEAGLRGDDERHLDALTEYYNAFYGYRGRAADYLRAAEDFESALIPGSAGYYLFETGKLLKDEALLNEALEAVDPVWERDLAADIYTEIALTAKKKRQNAAAADAAGRLFALNPGALRQNGIRLPVNVELDATGGLAPRRADALLKTLRQAGFDTNGDRNADEIRWTLRLSFDGDGTRAELYDGGTGTVKRLKAPRLQSFSARDRAEFANLLAAEVF
ncbi:MAG: hypothetical protein LBJ86_03635, partial [Spirochaetaceae bacterium]|nr:hypothetical protein [Spirochaetaceae bacterium]